MANDKTSSGTQMCDGAGDWSDCTARWQAMGGRRIKRSAGHERVAIPATVNICRAAAPCERDAVADNSHVSNRQCPPGHCPAPMDPEKLASVVLFTGISSRDGYQKQVIETATSELY